MMRPMRCDFEAARDAILEESSGRTQPTLGVCSLRPIGHQFTLQCKKPDFHYNGDKY